MCEVSVIVPFYGVEPYARECVESILSQTFTNFEAILVDDGSPDGCGAILDEYAGDSRVRVIHKQNGGLSSARNAGLDVARGTYVQFVDGDDVVMPELLERTVAAMRDGADLVSFVCDVFEDGRGWLREVWNDSFEPRYDLPTQQDRLDLACSTLLPYNDFRWNVWSFTYRRDVIERHGLRFEDAQDVFAEDLCFSLCLIPHVSRIERLREHLYRYRVREGSLTLGFDKAREVEFANNIAEAARRHFETNEGCDLFLQHFGAIRYLVMRRALQRLRRAWALGETSLDDVWACVRAGSPDTSALLRDVRSGVRDDLTLPVRREGGPLRNAFEVMSMPCVVGEADPLERARARALDAAFRVGRPVIYSHLSRANR